MRKICTKCGITKELSEFSKDKYALSGYTSNCKECRNKNTQIFLKKMKTNVPWYNAYRASRERCINKNYIEYDRYGGRGIANNLTLDEVEKLWFRDKAYLTEKPSIDRIDNDGDYTFENCQFIELKDNVRKAKNLPIKQLTKDDKLIKIWKCQQEARKFYGDSVKECLRKRCKSAYGYLWEYLNG